MNNNKKSGKIVNTQLRVQRAILEKLKSKMSDPSSPELKIRDLLEDPDFAKHINYPPAYEQILKRNIRELIEQGFIQYDKPLWDERVTEQGFTIRRSRRLCISATVRITNDGFGYLEFLNKEFKEKEDETTARLIPLEKPPTVPSSLLGLLYGELKGEFCLFIGAGASTSAGIPCGKDFRNRILYRLYGETLGNTDAEEEFRREFKKQIGGQELTLEMILSGLKEKFGNSVLRVLQKEVDGGLEPPPGYYSLAYLIRHGFFKVIFTVNFDELIEKALNQEIGQKEYNILCQTDEFKSSTPTMYPKKPLLLKLHGTYKFESTLTVSWEDVRKLSPEKANFLSYYAANYPIIFVGYGGHDPDIRSVLRQSSMKSRKRRIFWVSPNDLEEDAKEIFRWYNSNPVSNHIRTRSDEFFDELEHRLIGGYPRLKNEVSAVVLGSGAVDSKTGVDCRQIMQGILQHPSLGPRINECYKGRKNRLMRDIQASCQSLVERGHIEYEGEGIERKYWD